MNLMERFNLRMEELLDPGAGGGNPPEGGGTPASTGFDWGKIKETLPEDIRNDPSLSPITNLEGLAKSYIHAQKAIGKDKIVIPDKHATEDDWKNLFTKLGNPAKLEEYKLSLEDVNVDENVLTKIKAAAHAKGVLPWQLEHIVKEFGTITKEMVEAQENEYKTQREQQINDLKKTWGKEFENQVKSANVAMRHFLPDAKDQQALIDAGLGSNPALLKMLANAAKTLSEDAFVGQGTNRPGGMTPEDALIKARAIQGDSNHPYRNPAHPNHKQAKDEVANLYKIAFPE